MSSQTSLLERGRAEGPPSQIRRSPAHHGHNRGTPQNRDETQTSMDGSNRGRDVHIPTEVRQESEGQILAGPMGGWGVGHTSSDRFTRSRGVHSLHRYVEAKGQLCCMVRDRDETGGESAFHCQVEEHVERLAPR